MTTTLESKAISKMEKEFSFYETHRSVSRLHLKLDNILLDFLEEIAYPELVKTYVAIRGVMNGFVETKKGGNRNERQ